MKRLLGILALLAVALPAWGQVGMDIQPSPNTVTLGSQFDMTVRVLANSNQVDGAAAYLNYDAAVLFVVSTTPGPTLATVLQNDHSTPGQVNYAAGTFSSFPTTTFTLVTVRFQANALSAGTSVDLNVGPDPRTSEATFGGTAYTTVLTSATIVVVAPTETPTGGPTSTPTPTGGRPTDTPTSTPASATPTVPTPMSGQVIVEEDTPTPIPATSTVTRTPTNTRTATVTGTPPTATPTPTITRTPTSSRQDCCECPEANCSIPPVNGTCPQGCTLIPNACCNCGGGGEQPQPTHTPGGSGQTAIPSATQTRTPTPS